MIWTLKMGNASNQVFNIFFRNKNEVVENVDCQELLFKTNREIKSLNYKLMRIITSDENYHTLLQPYRYNDIDVIEQT